MFIKKKFCHTPNLWFIVDNVEFLGFALIFSSVQLGIFCSGTPFFSFHWWCTCHTCASVMVHTYAMCAYVSHISCNVVWHAQHAMGGTKNE